MNNLAGCVRVALILVLSFFSQGCAINIPTAGMPLAAGNTDTSALTAAAPLTGAITEGLPQSTNTASLLGTPGGTSFQPAVAAAPVTSVAGNTGAIDQWQGGKLPPAQFFALIAPAVLESSRRTGVPAAVTLAQAALETGYGASTVGTAKNLFGVRGNGPAGSVRANDNGEMANFKAYNSFSESIADHDKLLSTGSRYRGAMAVRNDPEQFAREIHKAGYATSATYSDQLIRLIRQYNLTSYTANA